MGVDPDMHAENPPTGAILLPDSLLPTPFTLLPAPYTLRPAPYSLNTDTKPYTINCEFENLNPKIKS